MIARKTGMAALVVDLARPYRGWLVIILAAMLVETIAGLAGPWPLKIVIDYAVGADHAAPAWAVRLLGSALAADGRALAAMAAVGMVLIAALGGVASYVDNYYTESVGQWVANDLRMRVYDHLERLSFNYYDTHQTGLLLSTMTDDVSTVQDFVSSDTLSILVDLMTIVGMLGLMFWLNWDFTLLVVAITPFLLLFVARFRRAVKKATREVRRRESDIVAVLQTGLESVRTVQAFGAQDVEAARLGEASRATVNAALKARRVKSLLSPVVAVIVALCTAMVLWRGTDSILAGAMTVGSLTVFLAYLAQVLQAGAGPREDDQCGRADTRRARAHPIHPRHRHEHPGTAGRSRAAGVQGRDRVRARRLLLQSRGSGPPGRHLLDRRRPVRRRRRDDRQREVDHRQPDSAFLRSDRRTHPRSTGRDIRDYTLRGLRRQIGFVLQETVLFRGTMRENIAYGRHQATEAQIIAAARLANADEFIVRMPGGYDTPIGERGVTLSGGQRQRIGIARAFIRDAPILILDEPTASLDTESEELVMEGLDRLMKGRTVIMITHRLNTIRAADTIVVLHSGVVAEQGTPRGSAGARRDLCRLVPDGPVASTARRHRTDPLTGAELAWRVR